jgi:DNA-binding transcriptional LysR family regulator
MSHSLSKLRELLADELLVRTPMGMAPTPRARALSEPLVRALVELNAIVFEGAGFEPATARRAFTLGLDDGLALVVVPSLMHRLRREAPSVEIVVRAVPSAYVHELEDERIDLVFSPILEPRAGLVVQKLYEEHFVCVLRREHPTLRDSPRALDLETFVALSHVLVAPFELATPSAPRRLSSGIVDEWLASVGRTRHIALRVPHFLVALAVVAASDLVATMPSRFASALAAPLGLCVLEPPEALQSQTVWQIWHERRRRDPALTWLREILAREFPDS